MKNPNKQTKPPQTNQTPQSNLSHFKALPEVFPIGMLQPGISEACKLVYVEGELRNLEKYLMSPLAQIFSSPKVISLFQILKWLFSSVQRDKAKISRIVKTKS